MTTAVATSVVVGPASIGNSQQQQQQQQQQQSSSGSANLSNQELSSQHQQVDADVESTNRVAVSQHHNHHNYNHNHNQQQAIPQIKQEQQPTPPNSNSNNNNNNNNHHSHHNNHSQQQVSSKNNKQPPVTVARKRGRRRQQAIPEQPNGLDRVFIWDIDGSLIRSDIIADSSDTQMEPSVLASVADKLSFLSKRFKELTLNFCEEHLFLSELESSDQTHIDDVTSESQHQTLPISSSQPDDESQRVVSVDQHQQHSVVTLNAAAAAAAAATTTTTTIAAPDSVQLSTNQSSINPSLAINNDNTQGSNNTHWFDPSISAQQQDHQQEHHLPTHHHNHHDHLHHHQHQHEHQHHQQQNNQIQHQHHHIQQQQQQQQQQYSLTGHSEQQPSVVTTLNIPATTPAAPDNEQMAPNQSNISSSSLIVNDPTQESPYWFDSSMSGQQQQQEAHQHPHHHHHHHQPNHSHHHHHHHQHQQHQYTLCSHAEQHQHHSAVTPNTTITTTFPAVVDDSEQISTIQTTINPSSTVNDLTQESTYWFDPSISGQQQQPPYTLGSHSEQQPSVLTLNAPATTPAAADPEQLPPDQNSISTSSSAMNDIPQDGTYWFDPPISGKLQQQQEHHHHDHQQSNQIHDHHHHQHQQQQQQQHYSLGGHSDSALWFESSPYQQIHQHHHHSHSHSLSHPHHHHHHHNPQHQHHHHTQQTHSTLFYPTPYHQHLHQQFHHHHLQNHNNSHHHSHSHSQPQPHSHSHSHSHQTDHQAQQQFSDLHHNHHHHNQQQQPPTIVEHYPSAATTTAAASIEESNQHHNNHQHHLHLQQQQQQQQQLLHDMNNCSQHQTHNIQSDDINQHHHHHHHQHHNHQQEQQHLRMTTSQHPIEDNSQNNTTLQLNLDQSQQPQDIIATATATTTGVGATQMTIVGPTSLRAVQLSNQHKQQIHRLSLRFHRIRTVYNMNRSIVCANKNPDPNQQQTISLTAAATAINEQPELNKSDLMITDDFNNNNQLNLLPSSNNELSLNDNNNDNNNNNQNQQQYSNQQTAALKLMSKDLNEILTEIDHYTLDWRKHALDCLRLISESPNCTNIIVTKLPLVIALGHLVCLGLGQYFEVDQIYSASKTNKEACLKRIKKRFGAQNRCSYIIVGGRDDVEMAKRLDLPSWNTSRSDGHRQLMQLYRALKEGFLM